MVRLHAPPNQRHNLHRSTKDLNRRFSELSTGRGSFTGLKSKPAELIYSESWPDRTSAVRRERQLKKWSRAKKLALAKGQLEKLHRLSESREGLDDHRRAPSHANGT
jgi:predicted GIY-YIG superfamily endonuclease